MFARLIPYAPSAVLVFACAAEDPDVEPVDEALTPGAGTADPSASATGAGPVGSGPTVPIGATGAGPVGSESTVPIGATGATGAGPSTVAPEVAAPAPAPMPSSPVADPSAMPPASTPVVPENVPKWGDVYYMINTTCANVVCHSPGYFPPDLTDSKNDLYQTLLSRAVEQCGGMPLVTPGDPANSAILKLPNRECGELVMPKTCTTEPVCLPEDKLTMLHDWIAGGAPM